MLAPLGVRDILSVAIPSDRRSMRFQLDRTDGAFTERDRLLEEVREEPSLTRREREVLQLVAQGMTNPQIAEALWLSPATVRKHLENVYAKLGVRTRTAAAARFLGVPDDEARSG